MAVGQGRAARFDRRNRCLVVPEALPSSSRTFLALKHAAQLRYADAIGEALPPELSRDGTASQLCQNYLSGYLASATMMPYEPFLEAVRETRYDVERLQRRFNASFEQVCHRATTLQRTDAKGVPLHFVRVDIAGNISKRFSLSGFRVPRYGGLCPRLNVHTAFLTPGRYCPQVVQMPGGAMFFSVARAISKSAGGSLHSVGHYCIMLGCDLSEAENFVYADALNLNADAAVTEAGVSCRLCDRSDCAQRVHAPILRAAVAGARAEPAVSENGSS